MKETGAAPGDLISPFDGEAIDGHRLPYEEVWQRRNVVLFVLSPSARAEASAYLSDVDARLSQLRPNDTSLVISHQTIAGMPRDGLVITDRWGEIVHVRELTSRPQEWPSVDDIVEWVEFVRMKCPECPP
jgi:hypothetical protein